jgi:hypothetical protein
MGSGIAYLVPTVGSPPVPPSPSTAAARPEPALPIEMAAAASASAPPESISSSPAVSSPSPTASVAYTPIVVPAAAQVAPAADSQPDPAPLELAASSPPPPASLASARPFRAVGTEPAPATDGQRAPVEPPMDQTPLRRDEMREVQARLRSFGFGPGSVDGVPGAITESAVMHYQRNRGQPPTGKVDRELLEQLRQDPAPQVAQRAPRPVARATASPVSRRSDPFEPVRAAGDRLGQWLQSLVR